MERTPTVNVMLSPDMMEDVVAEARMRCMSPHQWIRNLIAEELNRTRRPKTMGKPKARNGPPAATKPETARTAYELARDGYTASQIAAIHRMPYKQVLAEISASIDQAARCQGEAP